MSQYSPWQERRYVSAPLVIHRYELQARTCYNIRYESQKSYEDF